MQQHSIKMTGLNDSLRGQDPGPSDSVDGVGTENNESVKDSREASAQSEQRGTLGGVTAIERPSIESSSTASSLFDTDYSEVERRDSLDFDTPRKVQLPGEVEDQAIPARDSLMRMRVVEDTESEDV